LVSECSWSWVSYTRNKWRHTAVQFWFLPLHYDWVGTL
jgi:hypothetical protein